MKPYSMDLRLKVLAACDRGESVASVARRFDISDWTVREFKRRRAASQIEPSKPGPQGPIRLTQADYDKMRELVATQPGFTLEQIAEHMSVRVWLSTIHRALKKLDISLKKESLIPAEQKRPDVHRRREMFSIARRFVEPRQFVFLDESGAKTNMTRLYGRSPIGERCRFHLPHGHWKTTTLLSAIRLDGVIREATVLLDGPMNAPTFLGSVQEMLAPNLRPGDVVVMDNLAAHKVEGVEQAIERVGASVWYLPPYSPELNPIERVWSKVKTWLRRIAADTLETLTPAVAEILDRVSPAECLAYFRAAGYGED